MLCHYCCLLGHDILHYAGHYAALKNGKEVACQYGDWLKAMGILYGSPSKKKSKEFDPTSDADGETKKDSDRPTPAEAAIAHPTNPTEEGKK